ncbi:hypothetical protein D9M72_491610 [compost metagenome]
MVLQQWTGWLKSKKEVLQLLLLLQLVSGTFQLNKEKHFQKVSLITLTSSIPQDTLTLPLR